MRDGTKCSTWKDFAMQVMEELDELHELCEELNKRYTKDHEDYIIFRTKVYTIAGIIGALIIALFGFFEYSIRK
jgi:hypothetical protein